MAEQQPAAPVDPYIPAEQTLPEITIKAVILGIFLSVLLSGANAYLGLKAGMTVSASIPAAVISMAILRMFRRSNILENNIVQTAASAGESLAAGVIFTMPALVLLRAWTDFGYWQTTIIAGLGGMIGVLFTIPLRRALVVESPLKFPEGVATAEVLKVGDEGGGGIKSILVGAGVGAVFKFAESGLRLLSGVVEGGRQVGNSIAYAGTNASPALVAVGYIVGLNIAVLVFLGGAINWYAAIPMVAAQQEWPVYVDAATATNPEAWNVFTAEVGSAELGQAVSADDWANRIWSKRTRYLGVGAMLVGGLWALVRLWGSLVRGIRAGLAGYRDARAGGGAAIPRTERDTPMQWVGFALVASVLPLFFVFNHVTGNTGVSVFMAVVMLIAGFLFSAVASYMAGLVGSSNNPISGVTIATILAISLILLVLLGSQINFAVDAT
ncbi:MAG: oligopeptide transporter, OPT family, partial [Phycisphaerae bacterium]|nr:oligopeptide transporter, OPT family [Phycisphaerae bacterium]